MNTRRSRKGAFTLIEMLTTVAVLIIVFGLMISLARFVRARAAHLLTVDLLAKLEGAMSRYLAASSGRYPDARPFLAQHTTDEATLQSEAKTNNANVLAALRSREDLAGKIFNDLPITIYDERTVRDAWGSPIVFMRQMNPLIGMAPGDHYFFFSPGPDRRYLTRDDNLYSYDTVSVQE